MDKWRVGSISDISEFASIAGEGLHFVDEPLWQTYVDRVGLENCRGVWDGNRYVGGLAFYRMGQWYGGQVVSCAGVSGVSIDPADRGSGACKTLLIELLKELHRERIPLASLYASTQRLYRSVGFEQSGQSQCFNLPMSSLDFRGSAGSARELPVTRTLNPNFDELMPLAQHRARLSNGNLERTEGLWERIVKPIGQTTSTYLIGSPGNLEGYIVLVHGSRSAGYPQPLVASDWVATSPRALERLAYIVRDHRSMNDSFQWKGGPQDALLLSASEQRLRIVGSDRTLNRIVCVPEALEQRGYPAGLETRLELRIHDPLLAENSGDWELAISNGSAHVKRGGRGLLEISVSDLVPLYASLMTAHQLHALGKLQSSDAPQLESMNVAFSGPAPWTVEMF